MDFLLVADLDLTLVDEAAERSEIQHSMLQRLNHWLMSQGDRLGLVYSTSRAYGLARQMQRKAGVLAPLYWITAQGSEIYHSDRLDTSWSDRLSADWDWETVWLISRDFPALIPQNQSQQNPWKASFTLTPDLNLEPNDLLAPPLISTLQQQLQAADLRTQVLYTPTSTRLWEVDILPAAANKGNAMTYLRRRLGVHPLATLVFSESSQDLSLFEQRTRGVIVGNAQPQLLQWYRQQANSRVYRARSPYAAGIWEGLEHFGLTALV